MSLFSALELKRSSAEVLRRDLIAGITVAVMLIPQGMAYGILAGIPAIYGLYAALVPLLIYPLFGSSRHLSVGPVALVSIIVLSSLSAISTPGSEEFISLAILTALIAGIIQVAMSGLKLGVLVNYLSEPVISGFTAAAAIIISLSQLKYLLGIPLSRTSTVVALITDLIDNIGHFHLLTFLVGFVGVLLILGLKRFSKKMPAALIAVVISTALVYAFNWHNLGVDIVGEVPKGLPAFSIAFFNLDSVIKVLPLALIICLISFIESLSIAKTIASKHERYRIDANAELLGLGMAKIIGSFFQAFPNTGSFTRSAINNESGAETGWSSIFAAVIVGLTLIFLTPLFYFLPKPILAAVVISAVAGLISIPYVTELYRLDKKDFYVFMITFTLTLILGVQEGVFAGIALSVIMVLQKSSKPHMAVLGALEDGTTYRNINRYPEAETREGILIIRYDDDLFFGNADHFYDEILYEVETRKNIEYVVLNAAAMTLIDSTGMHKLKALIHTLRQKNIQMVITNLRGPMRDLFEKAGMNDMLGDNGQFHTIKDAVADIDKKQSEPGQ